MNKRGQIGFFVIAAIVVVIIVMAVLVDWNSGIFDFQDNTISEPVKTVIEYCLEENTKSAIFENGQEGGYFLPAKYNSELGIPYYYIEGNNIMPSKTKLEGEVEIYIDTVLDICLDDFEQFKNDSYVIKIGNISSNVAFEEEVIRVKLDMPTEITKDGKTLMLKEFEVLLPSEIINPSYDLAVKIVEGLSEDGICLTCFAEAAAENNIFVGTIPSGENEYIIDIDNKDHQYLGENYHLTFAIKLISPEPE